MNLIHKVVVTALIVALPALSLTAAANGPAGQRAQATTRDPGVNRQEHHQEHRIQQGVRSGELTREEARTLAQEPRSIRQEERAYKSDGQPTRDERKDLHQNLNQASNKRLPAEARRRKAQLSRVRRPPLLGLPQTHSR